MALTIENRDVERLVGRIASLTGETKTEAVRRSLAERYARLRTRIADASRGDRVLRFLETEVWSRVPEDQIGRMPSKAERERILGYGRGGGRLSRCSPSHARAYGNSASGMAGCCPCDPADPHGGPERVLQAHR